MLNYQSLLIPHLERLQELWPPVRSRKSVSLLVESTNEALASCAAATNKIISLASKPPPKSEQLPRNIQQSCASLPKKWKKLKQIKPTCDYES